MNKTLEQFIDENEQRLMDYWDYYKFEHHSDMFHYDDVDYWNEELFNEMCEGIMELEKRC